jgi:hypothetical protein
MSSSYSTQPFLLKSTVCIVILVKCQEKSESVTNMFPQGPGQDPSLLVNFNVMDLVLALWAYTVVPADSTLPPSLTN